MILCRTQRIVLRTFEEKDLETVHRWISSPRITAPGEPVRNDLEQYRAMFARDRFHGEGRQRYIVQLADESIVGEISCFDFFRGTTAPAVYEIGVLVGEMSARNKGIGTEAQRAMIDSLFSTREVNRVQAFTHVENLAEQHALENCGMKREGRLRQMVRVDGRFREWFAYSILRREWEESAVYSPTASWRTEGA